MLPRECGRRITADAVMAGNGSGRRSIELLKLMFDMLSTTSGAAAPLWVRT